MIEGYISTDGEESNFYKIKKEKTKIDEKINNYDDEDNSNEIKTTSFTNSLNNYSESENSELELKSSNSKNKELNIPPLYNKKFSSPLFPEDVYKLNISKSGEQVSYFDYKELDCKGILDLNSDKKKKNVLFLFDWDDTLFCTSVLRPFIFYDVNIKLNPNDIIKIQDLEISVGNILKRAINNGDTYIITNSEPGWVEYSIKRFFPKLIDLIPKIKIISARGLYEKKFPENYKNWKFEAFNSIVRDYNKIMNLPTNIICVGDSLHDLEPGKKLASKFPNSFIKTIKFVDCPNIEDLTKQLNYVYNNFTYIYNSCKNLTINIQK